MARGNRGKPGSPRSWIWLVAALCLLGMWQLLERQAGTSLPPVADTHRVPDAAPQSPPRTGGGGAPQDPALAFLPAEAHATLALIDRGGPFPHRQDGSVFQNRERLLPRQPRGHYREYTVDTPGLDHRGARRIVTGGDPPAEWYYTADHYRSFRRFERSQAR
ncbi:ribonuclease [Luteimonas padinae]|uniref:Ribonuclease domain-containing protein n=1 Tax=Luteimonas padinae TaxID=1714359 RepID=A0ABV6SVJ8_9GAMM|nr:ribonuclease domain-containing protein [Luteimonas padinae]GHD72443.1 ribonuclease [Luteimonas padinae]